MQLFQLNSGLEYVSGQLFVLVTQGDLSDMRVVQVFAEQEVWVVYVLHDDDVLGQLELLRGTNSTHAAKFHSFRELDGFELGLGLEELEHGRLEDY